MTSEIDAEAMNERYVFTKEDLAAKVDWEGGVLEAIVGYGINYQELPEDTPEEVITAWKRIEGIRDDESLIGRWLYGD